MLFVMLRHLYHCREHKIIFKMMQKLSKSVRWSWNYSSSKLQPPQHLIWEISTVFTRQSLATSGCMFSTSSSDVYCINCVCRFLAFSCWPSCAVSTPCPKPWMWHVWPSTSCSPCCQVCSQFVSDSFLVFFSSSLLSFAFPVVDHFYIALFSALEQTHCARMWFYKWIAFYSAFLSIHWSGVLRAQAWLVPHETATVLVCSVYTIQLCTMSLHAKPHT